MNNDLRAGPDPLPFVLAAVLLATTFAGGIAAVAIGFAEAASFAATAEARLPR